VIQRRRQLRVLLLVAGDILATAVAMPLAYWLRFGLEVLPVTKGVPDFEMYLQLVPVVMVLWPVVFSFQGLYQRRRTRLGFDEGVRLLVAIGLATLLLTAGLTFYRPPDFSYSRVVLALFAVVDLVLVACTRWGVTAVLARILHFNVLNVLVVGAGDLGREVAERLRVHRGLGFEVLGFLDDDPGKQQRDVDGLPMLGTTQELEAVVEGRGIDQVVIALPLAAHHRTAQLIRRAGQLMVEVKVVPDLIQYSMLRSAVEDLDGMPVINLTHSPLYGWNQLVKRAFDVTATLLLLLFAGWLFPLLAWLVKREDNGPVFYSQVRTGLDGRSFRLYKFRSMKVDAEGNGHPVWSRNRDPRVTRVGAFLRRTNLDELPQLLNVLKGDMSLVGPRPERPEFVERFRARYPEYMARHRVRTGLTGWAQVNGLRGDTSIRQRVAHDLYYIENWSFTLDLRILWRTFRLAVWPGRAR